MRFVILRCPRVEQQLLRFNGCEMQREGCEKGGILSNVKQWHMHSSCHQLRVLDTPLQLDKFFINKLRGQLVIY